MSVSEQFGFEALDSIQGTMNVVCCKYGTEPFTFGLDCTQHRFDVNCFFRGSGEESTYDSNIDE